MCLCVQIPFLHTKICLHYFSVGWHSLNKLVEFLEEEEAFSLCCHGQTSPGLTQYHFKSNPWVFSLSVNHLNQEVQQSTISSAKIYLNVPACLHGGMFSHSCNIQGARSNIVGRGTMRQSRKSCVWFPMRPLNFFNWCNLSRCIMALGTRSTRNLSGSWGQPICKADNLIAISELIS
jgi:hypothetical protein